MLYSYICMQIHSYRLLSTMMILIQYSSITSAYYVHEYVILWNFIYHIAIYIFMSQYVMCHDMHVGLIELWFTCISYTYINWDEGLDFCTSVDYVTHQSISITMVCISLALPALFMQLTATIVAAPIRIQHFT